MTIKKLYPLGFIILFFFIIACKDKKKDTPKADFDRKEMLANMGNNMIIPAYQNFRLAALNLDSAIAVFNLNPDATKLLFVQNSFKDAYLEWQACSAFEFGPAEQAYLKMSLNTFPANTTKINDGITSGFYNLNALANLDMKGLPGLDFLLFGIGKDNSEILAKYVSDGDATNRRKYLVDLSADIKIKITNVLNSWLPTGGNYINTFVNSPGTDIGSAIGLFTNQFIHDLEILKNYKLGIPLGKQSGGVLYPEKVEAYYSGISLELATINLQTLERIYLGKDKLNDGQGYDDYLIHLGAQYNGNSLNDAIKAQFSTAISKLQAVPNPLSASIVNNRIVPENAYKEIQKLVILLKTDMCSSMGILITFVDNDGD